jgi:hypothetical protein
MIPAIAANSLGRDKAKPLQAETFGKFDHSWYQILPLLGDNEKQRYW